jgi:maleylacetoacetate isomerase
MASSDFVLYSYFRSSASYRVRIALNLKRVSYEYRAVHLLNKGGEQHSEGYRKLNPSNQVPTLIHGDHIIGQSMAIIDYLDQIKPEPLLFPKGAFQRALVIQACEIINSGAQPLHNLRVLQELEKRFGATEAQKNEWTSFWIATSLTALENFLNKHAGNFCFGQRVTAADCFLIPHLANADRFQVPLDPFPTLTHIRANCSAISEFQKASPLVQPDTPPSA